LLHNLGRVGSFGLALPLMIYGLVLAGRDRRMVRRNGLLLLFVIVYSVMHLLTWAMVRYRLPVDAVLMPVVGWALVDLVQWLRSVFSVDQQKKSESRVELTGISR